MFSVHRRLWCENQKDSMGRLLLAMVKTNAMIIMISSVRNLLKMETANYLTAPAFQTVT